MSKETADSILDRFERYQEYLFDYNQSTSIWDDDFAPIQIKHTFTGPYHSVSTYKDQALRESNRAFVKTHYPGEFRKFRMPGGGKFEAFCYNLDTDDPTYTLEECLETAAYVSVQYPVLDEEKMRQIEREKIDDAMDDLIHGVARDALACDGYSILVDTLDTIGSIGERVRRKIARACDHCGELYVDNAIKIVNAIVDDLEPDIDTDDLPSNDSGWTDDMHRTAVLARATVHATDDPSELHDKTHEWALT